MLLRKFLLSLLLLKAIQIETNTFEDTLSITNLHDKEKDSSHVLSDNTDMLNFNQLRLNSRDSYPGHLSDILTPFSTISPSTLSVERFSNSNTSRSLFEANTQLTDHLASVPRPVVIFQAVDTTFLSLWLNWWAVALRFKSVPSHWELHLACFGEIGLNRTISKFHGSGCSQIIPRALYKKRIYFAKWQAATNALRQGKDLLVIDLDAVLIRDPRSILHIIDNQPSKYDIVSSRDHGPADLLYSNTWGSARFCTGFIFFKYSKKVLELVELALARCNKYGHDQIQFNNALARSGLVWMEPAETVTKDSVDHVAFIPWVHQTDPDYILYQYDKDDPFWLDSTKQMKSAMSILTKNFPSNFNQPEISSIRASMSSLPSSAPIETVISTDPEKIDALLLRRMSVFRYCNKAQRLQPDWINFLELASISPKNVQQIVALHCFADTGPIGEQGSRKKDMKSGVMEALNFWILKTSWTKTPNEVMNYDPSEPPPSIINYSHPSVQKFLEEATSEKLYLRARSVWLSGNFKDHFNPRPFPFTSANRRSEDN